MTLSFRPSSVVVRVFAVFGLVFATYNPSGYSYFHWLFQFTESGWLLKIAVGILMAFLYWVIVSITRLALGVIGGSLLLLVVVSTFGAMWQLDLWPLNSVSASIVLLSMIAIYLTIGVVYSPLRHRLSGQVQSLALSGR
jgi:hypothetical protein